MSGHVVNACTDPGCGLRFPAPVEHPRADQCPRCEARVEVVEPYPLPHVPPTPSGADLLPTRAVLDNVRSALNVGTMLRAADGARLEHVHLCGVTPEADHPKVRKTSLGAESTVPWSHHLDATVVLDELRTLGWTTWAVEATPHSVSLGAALQEPLPSRLVVIVGNEVSGVDPGLLRRADRHVHLPMYGAKTTLNVGVALGAVLYGLRTRTAAVER